MVNKRNFWSRLLPLVAALALLSGANLLAQSDNARISGTVTDTSGAAPPSP
jgi:hypothetical protein